MSQPVASTVPVTAGGLTCAAVSGRPSCMKSVGTHGAAHACAAIPSDAAVTANTATSERLIRFLHRKNWAQPAPEPLPGRTVPRKGLRQTTYFLRGGRPAELRGAEDHVPRAIL